MFARSEKSWDPVHFAKCLDFRQARSMLQIFLPKTPYKPIPRISSFVRTSKTRVGQARPCLQYKIQYVRQQENLFLTDVQTVCCTSFEIFNNQSDTRGTHRKLQACQGATVKETTLRKNTTNLCID